MVSQLMGEVPTTGNRTPHASPLALASPFGRRGDAARTSRQIRPTQWLGYTNKVRLGGLI
jgi:hypothetical protein